MSRDRSAVGIVANGMIRKPNAASGISAAASGLRRKAPASGANSVSAPHAVTPMPRFTTNTEDTWSDGDVLVTDERGAETELRQSVAQLHEEGGRGRDTRFLRRQQSRQDHGGGKQQKRVPAFAEETPDDADLGEFSVGPAIF